MTADELSTGVNDAVNVSDEDDDMYNACGEAVRLKNTV